MDWIFIVELVSILILDIVLAYIAARIDLYYIHRRLQRKYEQERLLNILKRTAPSE